MDCDGALNVCFSGVVFGFCYDHLGVRHSLKTLGHVVRRRAREQILVLIRKELRGTATLNVGVARANNLGLPRPIVAVRVVLVYSPERYGPRI